jgi:hypothetical protein
MMVLPSHPNSALLRSFWLVVILGAGGFAGILLLLVISPYSAAPALAVAAGLALLGWFQPAVAVAPYRWWNSFARMYARLARLATLLVTYYVVFAIVSLAGSKIALRSPKPDQKSMWVPLHGESEAEEVRLQKGWTREFARWAGRSGNWWALLCIPYFVLLSVLSDRQEADRGFPSGIYTLY